MLCFVRNDTENTGVNQLGIIRKNRTRKRTKSVRNNTTHEKFKKSPNNSILMEMIIIFGNFHPPSKLPNQEGSQINGDPRYGFAVPVTVPWAELDLDHVISAGQVEVTGGRNGLLPRGFGKRILLGVLGSLVGNSSF